MHRFLRAWATPGDITVLTDDSPPTSVPARTAVEFTDRLFCIAARTHSGSRLIDDAYDWSQCRAIRLEVEDELALSEEFRTIDPDTADEIRENLTQIERRVGEMPIERILAGLTELRQLVHENDQNDYA